MSRPRGVSGARRRGGGDVASRPKGRAGRSTGPTTPAAIRAHCAGVVTRVRIARMLRPGTGMDRPSSGVAGLDRGTGPGAPRRPATVLVRPGDRQPGRRRPYRHRCPLTPDVRTDPHRREGPCLRRVPHPRIGVLRRRGSQDRRVIRDDARTTGSHATSGRPRPTPGITLTLTRPRCPWTDGGVERLGVVGRHARPWWSPRSPPPRSTRSPPAPSGRCVVTRGDDERRPGSPRCAVCQGGVCL